MIYCLILIFYLTSYCVQYLVHFSKLFKYVLNGMEI